MNLLQVFGRSCANALVVLLALNGPLAAVTVDKRTLDGSLSVELRLSSKKTGAESAKRVFTREQLVEMSGRTDAVYFPYVDDARDCTVLPLAQLLATFPEADTVLAYCYDGYVSYFPPDFIREYEPFMVLDIEGLKSGEMQLEGGPDMGPYYITFAKPLQQGSAEMPDPDNKRPFGVYKLVLGTRDSLVGELFSGPFARLDHRAQAGRELWLNNCMSCHAWTEGGVGGDLSNRTAKLLAIHARFNKKYFADFTVDPTKLIPDVKMPKHPHYDKERIEAVRRFLMAIPN